MLTWDEFTERVTAIAALIEWDINVEPNKNVAVMLSANMQIMVMTPVESYPNRELLYFKALYPAKAIDGWRPYQKTNTTIPDYRSAATIAHELTSTFIPSYVERFEQVRMVVLEHNELISTRRALFESLAEVAGVEVSYSCEHTKLRAQGHIELEGEHNRSIKCDGWDTFTVKLSHLSANEVVAIIKSIRNGRT